MAVLRYASSAALRWPMAVMMVLGWCVLWCALVTPVDAIGGSGEGEFSYEEYDDEGAYHRPYELPDASDEGLEHFGEHRAVPSDDVLDPITDDDISYSGYYDEDGLDLASPVMASPVPMPVSVTVPPDGNVSSARSELATRVSISDEPYITEASTVDAHVSVASVAASPVNPIPSGKAPAFHEATMLDLNTTTEINALSPSNSTQAVVPLENLTSCAGHKKLSEQPVYGGPQESFIRKCCPPGQRMVYERSILVSCRKESDIPVPRLTTEYIVPQVPWGASTRKNATMSAIVAQFYDGCIEDLEQDIRLEFAFGNPCSNERGLVSFGARSNDTLYVIQNGSLLVIYGMVEDYDVFDSYCLDYDVDDGSLVGYVCPVDVEIRMDIIAGQLFILNLCLIFAIPLLLLTATLYMIVPELHDLHGRALAMNCVNFAIALLLESFFQHRSHGKRMNSDEMVLENYAEYFILATFFWLLVNCANNCFHAWFYAPKDKNVTQLWENRRFFGYAAVAQLIPLWIVLTFSTTAEGNPSIKHYFFRTIMVVLFLTLICLIICSIGLRRVKLLFALYLSVQQRLLERGNKVDDQANQLTKISATKINKVIYMANYTTALYIVMAIVWTVMTVTYYSTYELPIFYDILFGFQGILMFIIFVCLPRPFRTVKRWMQQNNYCGVSESPTAPPSPAPPSPPCVPQMVAPMAAMRAARFTTAVEPLQLVQAPLVQPMIETPKLTKLRLNNPFMYLHD